MAWVNLFHISDSGSRVAPGENVGDFGKQKFATSSMNMQIDAPKVTESLVNLALARRESKTDVPHRLLPVQSERDAKLKRDVEAVPEARAVMQRCLAVANQPEDLLKPGNSGELASRPRPKPMRAYSYDIRNQKLLEGRIVGAVEEYFAAPEASGQLILLRASGSFGHASLSGAGGFRLRRPAFCQSRLPPQCRQQAE